MDEPERAPRRNPKRRGITNAQAKYLARLQRQLGEPYTGSGMTLEQADRAIKDCLARLAG